MHAASTDRIWLLRELGYDIPLCLACGEVISGHIDIVQIRYGLIHILVYKPGARRESPSNS